MEQPKVKKQKKAKVVNHYRKKIKDENGKFVCWADEAPAQPEPEPES